MHWLRDARYPVQPAAQGDGVPAEEGEGVGVLVWRGVLVGVADLAGVLREVGLGVVAGVLREDGFGVVAGRAVGDTGADGCSVGLVTPTVAADGGLTRT
jgi:hypothetical protein